LRQYIARKIFDINERGTYKDPTTLSKDALLAQDEELFQTAKLVNCGWFGSGKLYSSTTLRPRWVFLKRATSCIFGLLLEHPWSRERWKQLESESVHGASFRSFSFS
jgi:hypothetical protein